MITDQQEIGEAEDSEPDKDNKKETEDQDEVQL